MNIFSDKVKVQKLVGKDLKAGCVIEFDYDDLKNRIENGE